TLLIRSNYFVTDQDSQVVVKRGIPGEVFGVALASVSQMACLSAEGSLTMHDQDALPAGCNVFTLGDLREPARESVRAGMPSARTTACPCARRWRPRAARPPRTGPSVTPRPTGRERSPNPVPSANPGRNPALIVSPAQGPGTTPRQSRPPTPCRERTAGR